MFRALLRTPNDFAIFFVRLALGGSLLSHGLMKVGLLGGKGLEGATDMAARFGFPEWTGYLLTAGQLVGGALLILGLFGRLGALAVGIAMAVAAWKIGGGSEGTPVALGSELDHYVAWWKSWIGSYHILAIGSALAILIRGSGALSIDRSLSRPRKT